MIKDAIFHFSYPLNVGVSLSIDWNARESVRANLRLMVKRILRKYKYPPDQQESAIDFILQQTLAFGKMNAA